jgi:poly(3-hydroxybutyrate) depolymerase
MALVTARTIPVTTHGRYLVSPPATRRPSPLLVGFHGYAEAAEAQLERLRAIPGADTWMIVSVQALHRFYRGRTEEVVAGWMTRQDRDLAIADNVAYVNAVVDALAREFPVNPTLVFTGFSQGVAMAFRAAASSARPVAGVMVCGGDVPPELEAASLGRVGAALIGRGLRDQWYTSGQLASDVARLREAGIDVADLEFESGHEWSAPFIDAAATFLRRCR